MTFTKEQLIEAAKTRMEANQYLLSRVSPTLAAEVALNLKVDEIALSALEAKDAEPQEYRNAAAIEINDEMVFAFCRAISDATVGADEAEDIKTGLRAAFANVVAPQPLPDAETEFFSFGSEHGFEYHKTAQGAIDAAEAAIDDYRGDACDGWSEEVDSICWGVIKQSSTKVGERPRTADDHIDPAINTVCDYALLPSVQAPQPAPVVPTGYTLVPIEPTEDMIIAGFESEPDESFSKPEEWEQYEAMSGCQQAAHRTRLCWNAMIAAAPEVGGS